ncbi:MAG: NADPH-dependent FMN reductase [Actinomycetales bacterium]
MPDLRIAVITGTTREGRFSEKVARWVVGFLATHAPELSVEVADLRDHPLPFFFGQNPARAPRAYPAPEVERLGQLIDRADGYLVLTGEYNHGYPAVLKNALDWFFVEWRRKPMAFVGWGNVGGARAIEQLRDVAVELGMAPLRHAVHVLPEILIAARSTEPDDVSAFAPLEPKLELAVDDLTWWAAALQAARAAATQPA